MSELLLGPVVFGSITIILGLATWMILWRLHHRIDWTFALVIGVICAITYVYNMRGAAQPYGGLLSDQTFQVTYVRSMASGHYLRDYYDPRLPAHYPPLYFLVGAVLVRFLDLSPIEASNALVAVLLLLLPVAWYYLARWLMNDSQRRNVVAAVSVLCLFGLGSYSTTFILTRGAGFGFIHWVGLKPHEVLSAFLTVWWLGMATKALERGSARLWIVTGILGGLGILLYYPFWVLGNMAFVLLLGWDIHRKKLSNKIIIQYVVTTVLSLLLSAFYWLPYAKALLENGAGPNYALKWFDLGQIDPSHFTAGLGYFGLVFWLGVYGLLQIRKASWPIRALKFLLFVTYFWIGISFLSFSLLKVSLLPQHAPILLFPAWSLFAGIGAFHILARLKQRILLWELHVKQGHLIALVLGAGLLTLPSAMSWNRVTDASFSAARTPIPTPVSAISEQIDGLEDIVLLGGLDKQNPGVIYFLPAVSQVNLYIAPVPYYSNPLSKYEERVQTISEVFQTSKPDVITAKLTELGVGGMLLTRVSEDEWGIQVATPHGYGYRWYWLSLPSQVLHDEAFHVLYKDDETYFALIW